MNINSVRYLFFFLMFFLFSIESVCATDAGSGRVKMQGAVTEAACAIDTSSRDQTIEMSIFPINSLLQSEASSHKLFSINLINCVLGRVNPNLPDWQRFQITFDGLEDHGFFGVDGQARGIALQIADAEGNVAIPGNPLPSIAMMQGNRKLDYSLRLVGNQQTIRPGHYNSTIRFKMNYY
ncbi:fimbrial protein [Rouxiella sp. Mn2063]|uniref:fimbrial protein n=1 Tax=Rouxiella sp. Mn2063 TaxID=3395262 RepID=UPI003BC4983C